MSEATINTSNRMPAQTKYIVGNEACERFCYYGVRSILAGYITAEVAKGGLGQSQDTATQIIHLFVFVNYFMPLLGAWLSDRILGRYHTILYVSLFYCLGSGVLACVDVFTSVNAKMICVCAGLGLIACGSGGIKPCVSAFMGDQFRPDQGHLLQKAYGAFYWAINFGSFFSFLIIPWMKNNYGVGWAFAIPGIFMAIATFIFWLGTPKYVKIPPSRKTKTAGFFKVFIHALSSQKERKSGQSFWDVAKDRFTPDEVDAARSVGPILSIFALIPIFWALFDQTSSTWIMQGEKMRPIAFLGFTIGAEQMQSANPAFVMMLVPLLTLVLYPKMGQWASPLRRMGLGMFLAVLSYLIVAWLQYQIEHGASLSLAWQILPYLVLTTAEVLISTTGLEFAFAEAAPQMRSTIMSFWNVTVAFGNLLVSLLTKFLPTSGGASHSGSVTTERFLLYAGMTLVVAVLFAIIASFYHYRHPSFTIFIRKRRLTDPHP